MDAFATHRTADALLDKGDAGDDSLAAAPRPEIIAPVLHVTQPGCR